ncbi:MAG: Lrp/AsnC family transcriptional regulator [Sphingomonadales bacterium]
MPKHTLDAIDRRILRTLQQDARISNVALADAVGLSPSPCLRRVKALEDRGLIRQYVALVDPAALDLSMNVFVQVTLERQVEEVLEAFEDAIRAHPSVMECYLMSGDADYYLRVVVPDLEAFERFLKTVLTRIPGVASIRSSFALKQVSYSTALPIAEKSG